VSLPRRGASEWSAAHGTGVRTQISPSPFHTTQLGTANFASHRVFSRRPAYLQLFQLSRALPSKPHARTNARHAIAKPLLKDASNVLLWNQQAIWKIPPENPSLEHLDHPLCLTIVSSTTCGQTKRQSNQAYRRRNQSDQITWPWRNFHSKRKSQSRLAGRWWSDGQCQLCKPFHRNRPHGSPLGI
jgi:hypothetical protein